MKLLKSRIGFAFALVAGMLLCGVASATAVTMNFDGITPGTSVHTYYDGGCSQGEFLVFKFPVDCGGPDYGVVWENAWVQRGGASAPNSMVPGVAAVMNVADGFNTGLSFDYRGKYGLLGISAIIGIYSDLNGDGTLLASGYLPVTDSWDSVDLSFSGIAKSATFLGIPKFDNVTFQAVAVPEPAELGVFGLGLLLIGVFVGLRRRKDRVAAGSL